MDGAKEGEQTNRQEGSRLPDGRDEMNLAEFPIALLADRPPRGTKTVEFRDRIFDRGAGREVARKLTITGSDRYGLPTALDDEVILGLIHLTKLANDFTERTVRFKRYELVGLLGWPMDGRSYRRVTDSLNRWLGVTLHYENAWWDKRLKTWTTRGFHIIENFEILDGRQSRAAGSQAELLYSTFSWNEFVFKSFQSDNLKRLDLDRYFSLKSAVSKRMFRFLDKRFYLSRTLKFDLGEFACEHIGLSRNNPPTKLKRHLQGALDELQEIGFIEPMGPDRRYTKVQKGRWTIVLVKGGPEAGPGGGERPEEPEASGLERDLVARGVTPATAAELASGYEAQVIRAKLEVFDWLMERRDRRVAKSPAGYLVKSIRDGYSPPEGFEAKSDRESRVARGREQRLRAEEARRRAEVEAKAREEAERVRVQAFWDALPPADQEKIREAALANANSFFLAQYRKERGKDTESERRYLKLIIDAYIQEVLSRGSAGAAREPVRAEDGPGDSIGGRPCPPL